MKTNWQNCWFRNENNQKVLGIGKKVAGVEDKIKGFQDKTKKIIAVQDKIEEKIIYTCPTCSNYGFMLCDTCVYGYYFLNGVCFPTVEQVSQYPVQVAVRPKVPFSQ